MWQRVILAAVIGTILTGPAWAADDAEAFTDPAKAGADYKSQGEYLGTIKTPEQEVKVGAQVIALGDGKFRGVFFSAGCLVTAGTVAIRKWLATAKRSTAW